MANRHKLGWHRRQYVTNTADPTMVTTWSLRIWRFHLKMVETWDVECILWYRARIIHSSYGNRAVRYLFNMLEDGLVSEQYDPEVAAAERRAGWDPNP